MTMTRKLWVSMIGVGMLTLTVGCAREMPVGPSELNGEVSGTALTSSEYVVTLMPDLTASPASLSVTAGYKVLFVNNSGKSVDLHSYNCSEFIYMSFSAGYSKNTRPFSPAGKTCDYFAYNASYAKILVGQVSVH